MAAAVLRRTREILPLLRLTSFDTSTAEGRSKERLRRVALSAAASAVARLTSIGTSLLTVPLTLHYLGTERYGLWMTLSTFTAMLNFADFGIGNGVLTAVATAHGREELHTVRGYVSSAFALLLGIAMAIVAVMAVLYGTVDWGGLFNVRSPLARTEAGPAITMFVACFALALPFSVVQRVQLGSQLGFMASLWQCAASLAGLVGVLVAIFLRAGLPWLVLGYVGMPVVVGVLNSFVFFRRVRPEFAPRPDRVSRRLGAEIAQIGLLFFVLQMAAAVTYTSDNFVIAHMLGADQVPQYAVPDRLFALTSMLVGFAVTPLWPAFGEAIARGDALWARRTLIRATVVAGAVGGGICLLLLVTGRAILHAWVGNAVAPSLALLGGFAVWRTMEALVGPISMYLNGLRAVRFQVVMATLTAMVVIVLEVTLIRRVGIALLPWLTTATFFLLSFVPSIIFVLRTFRRGEDGAVSRQDVRA